MSPPVSIKLWNISSLTDLIFETTYDISTNTLKKLFKECFCSKCQEKPLYLHFHENCVLVIICKPTHP